MTDSNFVIKKGLDIFDGDVSLKGSNKELRFYEGANYVGFEAPALSADKIWVLPNADGSTGQALKTDGSGNLGWVTAGDATLAGTQTFTGTKSFSSEVNLNNTYGRLNFKGGNNHSIDFYNANGAALKGRITYMISSNQMRLQANSADQLYITDGAIYPPVNNDVDLGTSSLKFKDSFFGLVDAENFKVNGGQGSDGQVLTSTGSGVAWEDVSATNVVTAAENGSGDWFSIPFVASATGSQQLKTDTGLAYRPSANKLSVSGDISTTGTIILEDGSGHVKLGGSNSNMIRYYDDDSSHYVAIDAPSTISTNYTLILPNADGSANQVLQTDGSGNLSWATVASEAFETITDVTIGSGTSGTTSGIYFGANNEAGIVAGEVSSASTANNGYIELMNMDLDAITGASGLQTIELTVQIEDETNQEVESFKALVQASEKTVLGTTARAVNFTEWAILFDGSARIGTLAADYDSGDDTIRIRYQNKQGSTATLTATFYAITMQNNT
tara:strand:- start:1100 stop:2602 length:1503 start_codon:yes stop_codon:yes gene_type:complete